MARIKDFVGALHATPDKRMKDEKGTRILKSVKVEKGNENIKL